MTILCFHVTPLCFFTIIRLLLLLLLPGCYAQMYGWPQGLPMQQFVNTAPIQGRPPTPVPVPIHIKSMQNMYMPTPGVGASRVGTTSPFSFNGILNNIKHFFSSPSSNGQQMPQIPPQLMSNPAFRQQLEQVLLSNPGLAQSIMQSLGQQNVAPTGNQMQARLAVPNSQPAGNLITQFPMNKVNSPQSRIFTQSVPQRQDDLFLLTAPFKASDDTLSTLINVANQEEDAKQRALLMKQLLEKAHPRPKDAATSSNNIVVQKVVQPEPAPQSLPSAASNSIHSQALPSILQVIKQLPDADAKSRFLELLKQETLLQEPSLLSEITSTFLTLSSSPRPTQSPVKTTPPTSIQAILKAHDEAKLRASTKRPIVSSSNFATSSKPSLKKIPDDLAERLRSLGLNPEFLPDLIRTANLVTNTAATINENLNQVPASSPSISTIQKSFSSPKAVKSSASATSKDDKGMQGLRAQLQSLPPDELTKVQNLIQLVVGKPHYLPRLLNEDLSPTIKRILLTVQKLKFPETMVTTTTTTTPAPVYITTTPTPPPTPVTETFSNEFNQIMADVTSAKDISNSQPQTVNIQTSASKVSTQATVRPALVAQDTVKQASTLSLSKSEAVSDSYVPLLYWLTHNGKGTTVTSSTMTPVTFNPQKVSQVQNQVSSSTTPQPMLTRLYPTTWSNTNIQVPSQSKTVEQAAPQSSTPFPSVSYIRNIPIEILGSFPPKTQSSPKPDVDVVYAGTKSATSDLKPVESASIQNLQIYGLRTTPKPTIQFDVTMPPPKRLQLPIQQKEQTKDEQPTIPLAALAAALEPKMLSTFLQSIQRKQEVKDGPNLFKIELSQESLPSSVPLSAVFNSVHLNSSNLMPLLSRFSNLQASSRSLPPSTTAAPPSYVSLLLPSSTVSSLSFFPFAQESTNLQPTASTTTLPPNVSPLFNPRALSTLLSLKDQLTSSNENKPLQDKENDTNKKPTKIETAKPVQKTDDDKKEKSIKNEADKPQQDTEDNNKKKPIKNDEDKPAHSLEYDKEDNEDKTIHDKKYGNNKKQIPDDNNKRLQKNKYGSKKQFVDDEDIPLRSMNKKKLIKQHSLLRDSEEEDEDENEPSQRRKEKKVPHSEKEMSRHFKHQRLSTSSEEERNDDVFERDSLLHEKEREASQSQSHAKWATKHHLPTSSSSEERHEQSSGKHFWHPKPSKGSPAHSDRNFKHRPFSASSSENQREDSRESLSDNKNNIKPMQQGTSWHEKYHPSFSSSSEDPKGQTGKKSLWHSQKNSKNKFSQKYEDWPVKPRFSSSTEDENDRELSPKGSMKYQDRKFLKLKTDSDWNVRHNSPSKMTYSEDNIGMDQTQLRHHQAEHKPQSSYEEIEPEHEETRQRHDFHEGQKKNFFKQRDYIDSTQIKALPSDHQRIEFHKTSNPKFPSRPFDEQRPDWVNNQRKYKDHSHWSSVENEEMISRPTHNEKPNVLTNSLKVGQIPDRDLHFKYTEPTSMSQGWEPVNPFLNKKPSTNNINIVKENESHRQVSTINSHAPNREVVTPSNSAQRYSLKNPQRAFIFPEGIKTDQERQTFQEIPSGFLDESKQNDFKNSEINQRDKSLQRHHSDEHYDSKSHPPSSDNVPGTKISTNSPEKQDWAITPAYILSPTTPKNTNDQGMIYGIPTTPSQDPRAEYGMPTSPPHDPRMQYVTPTTSLHDVGPQDGNPTTPPQDTRNQYGVLMPPPHDPRMQYGIPTSPPYDQRPPHDIPTSPLDDPRTQNVNPTFQTQDGRNKDSKEDNLESKPTILEDRFSERPHPPPSSSLRSEGPFRESGQMQQTLQVREPPCTHKPNLDSFGRDSSETSSRRLTTSIKVKAGENMASSQIYQITSPFSKDKILKINPKLPKGRSFTSKMTNSYHNEPDKVDQKTGISSQLHYRPPTQTFSAEETSGSKSQSSSNFKNSLWGFQGITDTSFNNFNYYSTQPTVFQTTSQNNQFSEIDGFLPNYPETTTTHHALDSFTSTKPPELEELTAITEIGPRNRTKEQNYQNANSTENESTSSTLPLGLESQDVLVKTPGWPSWTTENSLTKNTQPTLLPETNASPPENIGSESINTAFYNSNFTQPVSVFSLPITENPEDMPTELPGENKDNSDKNSTSPFPNLSLWPTFFSSNSEKAGLTRDNITNKSQENVVVTNHTDVLTNSSISQGADQENLQSTNSSFIDDNAASATDLKDVAMNPPHIDVYTRIHNPHKLSNKTIPAFIPPVRKINLRPTNKKILAKQKTASLPFETSNGEQMFDFGNWPKKQEQKAFTTTSSTTTTTTTVQPRKIKLRWSGDKASHRKVLNSKPVNFYNFYQPNSETE